MTGSANQDRSIKPQLPASFFVRNRQRLQDQLGEQYLVLLLAGSSLCRTADEDYPFFANRNFFYLCGIEQENAMLLLFRQGADRREILFLPARDALQERWTGRRLSREQATLKSGMAEVLYRDSFEAVFLDLASRMPLRLWLDFSANNPQAAGAQNWIETKSPGLEASNLSPFLTQLRMVKSQEEIACLNEAIALTNRGIAAMMQNLRPGMMEYQLWSHFNHALALEGCLAPAFPSIVAAGENIFCMHYMHPGSPIRSGDLVQIDVGATAGGLCADISRAFPANGRFSQKQLAIYELVRECQETAFATIRPGVRLSEINERCRLTAQRGLAAMGFINSSQSSNDYFWHGVSHHLGLDVHDVANREALLQKGMVITVEPGIYLPLLHLGLRLEDDVLVTENGCLLLSRHIPREASEIEAALQNRPL